MSYVSCGYIYPDLHTFQGAVVRKLLLLSLLVLSLAVACDNTEKNRDALMSTANGLQQSGKYAEAREQAQKALELDPKHGKAYMLIARCYMDEKNTREAITNYLRALELLPGNIEILEKLSRLNLIAGELAWAEKYADQAAALAPGSLEVQIVKAGVYIRKKDYARAEPLLKQVLASSPTNEEAVIGLATIAINNDKPDEAKAVLEKAVKEQSPPSLAVLSMLSNLAADSNDMASAEVYLKQIMELSDADEQVVLQLAAIYQASDRTKEVPDLLGKYLAKHPEAINVRTSLAELSLAAGNTEEALKIVDAAPDNSAKVRLLRAGVLTQSGKVEESLPVLQEITKDASADKQTVSAAYMGLASIFVQQNKTAEAEQELTALIERDPENIQALFMRSGLYFNRRDFANSLSDMEKVVKLAPNDPSAHLGLADVLNASGDSEKAEAIISDVIARFPGYAQAYITMANLQMMQGTPEAALMTLDIGKNVAKGSVDLIMARTDILVSLKRYDEAKKGLEEFSKENPDLKTAAQMRLADIEALRERYGAAAKIYEDLLKENPDMQTAVEGYLHSLVSGKKLKEAQAFAAKRSKERPEDPSAAYIFGEIALLNKDLATSEKAFKKALELNPAWEQPLTRLAQLYTASNRLSDAIKLCEDLIEKDPKAISPAVLLGILLEQKGDLDAAEKQYRSVLERHQDNLLASNNLAYLLSRHKNSKDRLQEAEELAKNATASGAPATFDTLGWIQHQMGNNEEAEKNIRKAYEDLKDNPTITYHLAAVLAASGSDAAKQKEALGLLEEITRPKAQGFAQMGDARKLLQKLKPDEPKKEAAGKKDSKPGASAKPKQVNKPKPVEKPKPRPVEKPKPRPVEKPKPVEKPAQN